MFITECEFDNTDMEWLLVLNCGMYQALVHIDQ